MILTAITPRIAPSFLLSLLLLCGAGIGVQAQEPGSVPEQNQDTSDAARIRPARDLAHQSREAAGEEKDEMEEFKHSSSVQMISRLTGLNLQQSYWLSLVLDFAVIAGLIIWAGRKYLPGVYRDRTTAIQKAMQEAQKPAKRRGASWPRSNRG
jgi:hypothetical protein